MLPPIASNFVAGESAEDALEHVAELNARGVGGILNLLGEHYTESSAADADADAYIEIAQSLQRRGLDASVSVKPSQIGLAVGEERFRANLDRIIQRTDGFVWIDMEDHSTTDVTLDAFEHHALETDGEVGVCTQANLRRTPDDLERLADLPGKVRLVKGAYDEPGELAYREKASVDRAFRECLELAFSEFDGTVAVGSHDPAMVEHADTLHQEYGTAYEIQMLMGVRENAQYDLSDRVPVYQYIPYGSKWLSYFYRRVRERKANALFALRAILS
jgi:proline dehydrogenase